MHRSQISSSALDDSAWDYYLLAQFGCFAKIRRAHNAGAVMLYVAKIAANFWSCAKNKHVVKLLNEGDLLFIIGKCASSPVAGPAAAFEVAEGARDGHVHALTSTGIFCFHLENRVKYKQLTRVVSVVESRSNR